MDSIKDLNIELRSKIQVKFFDAVSTVSIGPHTSHRLMKRLSWRIRNARQLVRTKTKE